MTKYLIFDFDGVLGDTLAASSKVKVKIGDAENEQLALEQIMQIFEKPLFVDKTELSPEKKQNTWPGTQGGVIISLKRRPTCLTNL